MIIYGAYLKFISLKSDDRDTILVFNLKMKSEIHIHLLWYHNNFCLLPNAYIDQRTEERRV